MLGGRCKGRLIRPAWHQPDIFEKLIPKKQDMKGVLMNREAQIAQKIEADYGDVAIHLNIFDIFGVSQNLSNEDVERLKDVVLETALEATTMLRRDVVKRIGSSYRNREFLDFLRSKGITLKI